VPEQVDADPGEQVAALGPDLRPDRRADPLLKRRVAPRAIDTGNAVDRPITAPRGPSLNRMPGSPIRGSALATIGSRL